MPPSEFYVKSTGLLEKRCPLPPSFAPSDSWCRQMADTVEDIFEELELTMDGVNCYRKIRIQRDPVTGKKINLQEGMSGHNSALTLEVSAATPSRSV